MSSLHFVVSVGEGDQLNDRIREVADKINKYGTQSFPTLNALKVPAKQVVVGNSYLGVLLADGRAFRVAYSVIAERLDLSKHDSSSKNNGSGSGSGGANAGGGSGGSSSKSNQASSRQFARSTRARIMRTTSSVRGQSSRSTGVIIGGSNSGRSLVTVPATFVPEELISQAQVVLQGKSRNLIIRELQRTNLDVNLAVNNLLSRDDEEGEDTEEGSDNYVPEDLISLLDSGIHPDPSLLLDNDAMFSEDMRTFRNLMLNSRDRMQSSSSSTANQNDAAGSLRTSGGSTVSAVVSGNSSSGTSTSLTFGRIRDRTYFGPRRWFQSTRDEVQWDKDQDSRKLESTSGFPLWISDDIEYWPEKDGTRFTHIAALHSEFIAVSTKGDLHLWRWCDREPYKNNEHPNIHHPKTLTLGLSYEKIVHISASTIRCSVVTESAKIATWMDETLGNAGNKLEHPSTCYPEFTHDKITSLHTCSLYTVAKTESGELFWWGVLPFNQRKKMWEKYKAKSKKPQKKDKDKDSINCEVTVGAQVCMKNSPMYQPGAIGFCISNGVPKVGQLLNAAWDLMNICRFKILTVTSTSTSNTGSGSSELKDGKVGSSSNSNSSNSGSSGSKETADRMDMPPPPSPASSTCSDTSIGVKRKRYAQKEDADSKKDEEFWNLKDVVFVEDVRSVPVGRVLKVDGQFAAVRFPSTSSKDKFDETSIDAWQDCRLLRKDDLQIIKSTATSRVPDCIQKFPRRIILNPQLNETTQLITLSIDSKGIHTIMKSGQQLQYSLFNLSGGRIGKSSVFPTDINSFLGKSQQNVSLMCAGDQPESILILRDGNKTIYPMAKDCLEAVRDPTWMDLPPISCVAAAPVTITSTNVNTKTQVTLVVLATEQQILMPKIMQCDVEGVKYLLQQFNNELKSQVPSIVQEFTDGNRNILHAVVSQCSPASNKDTEPDLRAKTTANTSSSTSNIVLDCLNPINAMPRSSSNIRDLMRRSSSTSALSNDVHMSSSGAADDNSINLSSYWTNDYDGGNSCDEDSLSGLHMHKSTSNSAQSQEIFVSDPAERRVNALVAVQLICENASIQPHLRQLLSAKDATGQTPLMLAVSVRAYQAALIIFDAIRKISNGDAAIRDSMVFPTGSSPDQSPFYVLCCNDTCSFTWTGADHISQDIFECQTCGLSGSLCCCTECAKVCHKGHDCKLKQTTPTAYCDCWQKCKCKALISGNIVRRAELLEQLLKDTDLVTRFNSRGEPILLFLIQTVGRQSVEQRQYRSARGQQRSSSGYLSRKPPPLDTEGEMPEHDLEPPRFARRALERLLNDWNAVRSMIQTGVENELNLNSMASQVFYEDSENKTLYINSQSGTIMLDKFTHILFFRCNSEPLDALLSTLIKELQNDSIPGRIDEAQKVARRFVRSVARVFVIFSIEKSNNPDKQRNSTLQGRLMTAFKRVFNSLLKFAIEELVEIADALIAPVRLGVVRPTAPFQLSSSTNTLDVDDLFSVEPLAPTSRSNALQVAVSSRIDENAENGFLARITSALRNDLDDGNDPDAMVQDDGDISEQDDSQSVIHSRQNISNNNNNNVVDDVAPDDPMVQDGGNEGESDNEFNFQEVETESDSDDNQSTQDAGRSIQTGATAGSDTDDTGDSSQPDEDGSEDGDSDEQSTEEFVLEDTLERRTTNNATTQRNNAPPHSLHWAIRSRDTTRTTNLHRLTGSSNLVFIDPTAIRRSTSTNAVGTQEAPTMGTTSSALARAFGIVLRQISELVGVLAWKFACPAPNNFQTYEMSYADAVQLQISVEKRLKPTWDWILTVMDSTEAQLRFGASLTDSTDAAHPLHPSNSGTSPPAVVPNTGPPLQRSNRTITIQMLTPNMSSFNSGSRARERSNGGTDNATSRRDFLTYCLSLMRSHNSEHRDSLPVLDVTALRHIAYVLDAIIFYMRASNELDSDRNESNTWDDQEENENDDVEEEFPSNLVMDNDSVDDNDLVRPSLGKRHSFFQRSESTLCLGSPAPDPFNTTMAESLPLAEQPQLLQPNARREDLFGMPKQAITVPTSDQNNSGSLELPPIRLGLSSQSKDANANSSTSLDETSQSRTSIKTVQGKTIVTIGGKNSESLKRSHSPKAGPSDFRKHFEEYEDDDDESGDDEPQDLSRQTKMSVVGESEKPESDDSDGDSSAPALKKHRLMESQDEMSRDVDPSTNRPPIIVVTRRNVAEAIENVTANVLAKNKKASLSECVGNTETPLNFLPANFGYDESKNAEGETSTSKSSSVIVRAGPSTSTQQNVNIEQNMEGVEENQEVSANVTIETTNNQSQTQLVQELPPRGVYFRSNVNSDLLLGRWRLSLILFGRVFQEDVGMEPGSIISELGGFPVKEAKFRRHMEKLRNGQQRDLTLSKIDRARNCLIPQTFKELNTQYNNNTRRIMPPLAFNRVKVTFKDEPGEGSGVARSFYTLIAEALLSRENLPNLESAQVGTSKYNMPFSTMIRTQRNSTGATSQGSSSVSISNATLNVPPPVRAEINEPIRRLTTKRIMWRNRESRKVPLNYDARPFRPQSEGGNNEHLGMNQIQLGERLYSKIMQLHPLQAAKITGMLLDLPAHQWIMLVSSEETLRQRANEAMAMITYRRRIDRDGSSSVNVNPQQPTATVSLNISDSATLNVISNDGSSIANIQQPQTSQAAPQQQTSKKLNSIVVLDDCQIDDNAPLFYQPGKPNFYSPRQGYPTCERINAFRNVGRLIGLCLLQNELLPIFLQRHVLKFILGRQIRFHDLAFFDPIVYESLRQLVKDTQSKNGAQLLQSLELNFVIDLGPEEGGGSVELVHNGRDVIVNEQNVYDYVRKYAEYRMIKTQEKALEAIRLGVFDVLPENALDSLTAEDLRLLLNGVGDINVSVLSNYTTFNDESNESAEKLQRFKRWLWQIVERMTNLERQDLIYFWTGSPALPASEEGFQPMPTVTIRPADDAHLPTANTCISRLYIPLYSSKAILRHKLLMAIKTKNFGFV